MTVPPPPPALTVGLRQCAGPLLDVPAALGDARRANSHLPDRRPDLHAGLAERRTDTGSTTR